MYNFVILDTCLQCSRLGILRTVVSMLVTLLKSKRSAMMNLADYLYTRSSLSMSLGVRGPDRVGIGLIMEMMAL